jgi:alkylation response protein AidB-like acyl-CoA dehydrogenase
MTQADTPSPAGTLTDEEALLQASVREFAASEVAPLSRAMDAEAAIDDSLLSRLFELGLMGLTIPEEHGGGGGTLMHAVLAVEALSAIDPSVALIVDVQNTLVNGAIRRWGTDAQQHTWLPRLAGSDVGAYALSEAGAGSDAFALDTRAERMARGYRITGRKLWITNAHEASLFIVFATIDRSRGHRGITAFLLPRNTPGLSVGHKEEKLGIRASSTCELVLDGCEVDDTQVLGLPGEGYKVAMETLNEGRIGIGAQMVGLADGALRHAINHVKARRQFGQSIAGFQGVQFQLARAATDIEAARALVYGAARLAASRAPIVVPGAMCKLFASEVAERVASLAVNLLGGSGFVKESPVERLYRDAKIGQIYEGTSNLQLLTVAKALLK